MRRSVATSALGTLALAVLGALACATDVSPTHKAHGTCTGDLDCDVGESCIDGECASSVPIGSGEGEGATFGGEGEGAPSGEGEGATFAGEGEGVAAGEGEGEGSAAESGALLVTAGPDLVDALPGCECDVQNVPASNVNLAVSS
jgi:hypothetical protein